MTPLEQSLMDEACGGRTPRLLLRTRTRVDAGLWWRTTPLWLAIDGEDLVLLAVARRKYTERVPLADCQKSRYCPSSGHLVIAPCERIPSIALSLSEALRVLDEMGIPTP